MKHHGLFLLLIATGAGCAPPTYDIHGKVTLDGVAVPDAQITFVPADEKLGASFIRGDKDGHYRILLRKGDYTVRIAAQKSIPAPAGTVAYNGRPVEKTIVDVLPIKYGAESQLRTTVNGAAPVNFELLSEPDR
jgi:hypothetical protein